MDKNIRDPEEKSKIEQLIHMTWFPEWHVFNIKNYVYNFKNIKFFISDVLKFKFNDYDNELEDQIKDLLILETISSTMFLAEAFASLVGALKDKPENMQDYLKDFRVTLFYREIDKLSNDEYLKILSIPPNDFLDKKRINDLSKELSSFKEILAEIKTHYFKYLDLFNSYKHGFRIFPLLVPTENGKLLSVIMNFSKNNQKNQVVVQKIYKNPDDYLQFANLISHTFRILLKNFKNKSENPTEWEVCIPAKKYQFK